MLTRLHDWCFAPSARYQPGLFRIVLAIWILHDYLVRLFPRLDVIAGRSRDFLDPSLVARAVDGLSLPLPPDAGSLGFLRALAYGVAGAAVLGISTRLSLIALASINLYLGAAVNSWGYAAHSTALPALLLVILAAAPGATTFSCDALFEAWQARRRGQPARFSERMFGGAVSVWPVRLTLLLLCLFYFASGHSKLRHSGLRWTDGRTLDFYLSGGSVLGSGQPQRFLADPRAPAADKWRDGFGLVDYAYFGRPTPLGRALSRSKASVRLLSIATLLFELSFPLVLLGRRITFGYLLAGAAFHAGIMLTLQIDFWSSLVVYLLFVDWRALGRWAKRRTVGE
jgi:hypothetical protein